MTPERVNLMPADPRRIGIVRQDGVYQIWLSLARSPVGKTPKNRKRDYFLKIDPDAARKLAIELMKHAEHAADMQRQMISP